MNGFVAFQTWAINTEASYKIGVADMAETYMQELYRFRCKKGEQVTFGEKLTENDFDL